MDISMSYRNPLVERRADPWVYLHTDGYYYFTGTYPKYDRIELRRARTLNGLRDAEAKVIWQGGESGELSRHIWAPEIHYIDGAWYIYFTGAPSYDEWRIRPYLLKCCGDDPMTGEWNVEGRIYVGEDSFSLDMTTFSHKGRRYALWAQKLSEDEGSNIYIAPMKNPRELDGKPVLLTKPEYDWECFGFRVNEGPAVLVRNGRVIVTYSAADTGWKYCMGMLWADENSDLLDPASWRKSPKPVFVSSERNRQYGPGHNCFTTDRGRDVLIYHCRDYKDIVGDPLEDINRHARAKMFDYNEDGLPVFGEPERV